MGRTRRDDTRDILEGRARRIPLGTPRTKMSVRGKEPGYVYRWINDLPGRLKDAEDGGYEYVYDEVEVGEGPENERVLGQKVARVVGGTAAGMPKVAFLMRVKQEWYDDDQAEKQRHIDEKEKSIIRGQADDGGFGADKRYIPKEGIRIEHN